MDTGESRIFIGDEIFPPFHHIQSPFQSPFPHFIHHFIHHKAIVLAFASSAGWQREAKRSSLQPSPRAAETQGRDKKGWKCGTFLGKKSGDAGEKTWTKWWKRWACWGKLADNCHFAKLSCNHGYLLIFEVGLLRKTTINKNFMYLNRQMGCVPFFITTWTCKNYEKLVSQNIGCMVTNLLFYPHVLWFLEYFSTKPRSFPWLVRSRSTTPSKALFTSYESVFLKRSGIIWLLISWENMGKLHVGSPKHFRNSMLRNLWFNRLVEKG